MSDVKCLFRVRLELIANISKILFTADAFRSASGEPRMRKSAEWLDRRLGNLLRRLTGLTSQVAYPLAGDDIAGFVALQGELGLDNWARMYDQKPTPALVSALRASCENSLIVSIESPPLMEEALNRACVPWIDVSVSPLRFLPDWGLHVRSSRHFNLLAAPQKLLKPFEIENAVHRVTNFYGVAPITEPTVVFFAQADADRTLINNGRFCDASDALNLVKDMLRGRPLLVKPHPWQNKSAVIDALVEAGGQITNLETYSLLSNSYVEVGTLSSSTGWEARAFGRTARIYNAAAQERIYSGVDVFRYARAECFWGPLLASGGITVAPSRKRHWRPNEIREDFGVQGFDLNVWRHAAANPSGRKSEMGTP
jgi:hypothetical protein